METNDSKTCRLFFVKTKAQNLNWSYEQVKDYCKKKLPSVEYWCDCSFLFDWTEKQASLMEKEVEITHEVREVYTPELADLPFEECKGEINKRLIEKGISPENYDLDTISRFIEHGRSITKILKEEGYIISKK